MTSDPILLEEEKRKTIKEQEKQQLAKHKLKMIELEFARESEALHHDNEMQRTRIKTAEIRKAQERKDHFIRSERERKKKRS